MGILDEAIREHLELKRQHGAADSELKELEDEAFGPPERPGADGQASDAAAEAPTEFMAAPEAAEGNGSEAAEASAASEGTRQRREPASIGDLQEAPPEPAEEEQPAAEQPTEHFDVEEELAASAKRGPSDEELVEEEMGEPRLAPVDPLGAAELEQAGETDVDEVKTEPDEDEDDFFDEQRLSDELDQALEAPLGEDDSQAAEAEPLEELEETEEGEEGEDDPDPDSDVLEKTPDFLEDTPEDDELWFEQKPPKDFDFDD
jgi:hypothetical protein